MCGIAGVLGSSLSNETAMRLGHALLEGIRHRGPDGEGVWVDRGTCLVHARLAILDLDGRARQPMASPDGRWQIVFNGEIYNFKALRAHLQARGERFETESDTEVLLRLWALEGRDCLTRLRGMYAFAVWDTLLQRGWLVRDPLGIKPLYYTKFERGLAFCSELRPLVSAGCTSRELNPDMVAKYFSAGSVPEPGTLLRDASILPAGHLVEWSGPDDSPVRTRPLVDVSHRLGAPEPSIDSIDQAAALVRTEVEESVAAHLVADVPVGVFLSGGVDSTIVLASAARHAPSGLTAYTLGVDVDGFDETSLAMATAARFGVAHRVLRLEMASARARLGAFMDGLDQPTIDGFNTYIVSELAHQAGARVVLSGLGADELFGGYPSFQLAPRLWQRVRQVHRVPGARSAAAFGRFLPDPRLRRLASLIREGNRPEDAWRAFRGVFAPADAIRIAASITRCDSSDISWPWSHAVPDGDSGLSSTLDVTAVARLESDVYMRNQLLRDSDVFSMRHALELRVPFVDAKLQSAISRIGPCVRYAPNKALLKRAFSPELDHLDVRDKRGFRFPFEAWLRQGLLPEAGASSPVMPRTWYQHWSLLAFFRWHRSL